MRAVWVSVPFLALCLSLVLMDTVSANRNIAKRLGGSAWKEAGKETGKDVGAENCMTDPKAKAIISQADGLLKKRGLRDIEEAGRCLALVCMCVCVCVVFGSPT